MRIALLGASDWAITAPGLRKVLQDPQCWPRTIEALRLMLREDLRLAELPLLWELGQ